MKVDEYGFTSIPDRYAAEYGFTSIPDQYAAEQSYQLTNQQDSVVIVLGRSDDVFGLSGCTTIGQYEKDYARKLLCEG